MNGFLQIERGISALRPAIVGELFGIPIANSTMFGMVILLVICLLIIISQKRFTSPDKVPGSFQVFVEYVYELLYGLIRQVAGNDAKTKMIFPLTGSVLLFVLLSNVFGLLPGIGAITVNDNSLLRTPTSDINMTLPLALVSVLIIHGFMVAQQGIFGYLGNFIKIKELFLGFRKGIGAGVMSIVDFFMGLLDIVGEIAKVLSMSLRLFGNLFAGDVLMAILLGIFSIGIPALWLGMSVLSAVVQAAVFASLITIFFSLAVSEKAE